jgi:hypothetical protein
MGYSRGGTGYEISANATVVGNPKTFVHYNWTPIECLAKLQKALQQK